MRSNQLSGSISINSQAFIEKDQVFDWEVDRAGELLIQKLANNEDDICINEIKVSDVRCTTITFKEFLSMVA
jgi:redox-regulated HSP33 family molecular chaperone